MENINLVFQEEYKRLDNCLRDMFCEERGVSAYLEEMETVPLHEQALVPSWDSDFSGLKQLRRLRNRLAHEVGTLTADLCTPDELAFLENFYRRILSGQDPLAMLRREKKAEAARIRQARAAEAARRRKEREEASSADRAVSSSTGNAGSESNRQAEKAPRPSFMKKLLDKIKGFFS